MTLFDFMMVYGGVSVAFIGMLILTLFLNHKNKLLKKELEELKKQLNTTNR